MHKGDVIMKKRIIWSNMNINPDDWKEGYKEATEINGWDEDTEDEVNLWRYIDETLDAYLGDERMNLNVPTDGRILLIADLGLWYGRRQGYQIREGNVKNILYDGYNS